MTQTGEKYNWISSVPYGWELVKLKYLSSISTGVYDTQDKLEDGAFPFFVRSPHVERIDKYSHDCEAVMTAGDGVGVGKVFHYYNGKFAAHQRVYVFNQFKNNVNGKYIYYSLMSNLKLEVLQGNAKSTVDSLRYPMLSNFPILLPSSSTQNIIVYFLERKTSEIDALISDKEKLIALLKEKRQTLITEAVTKGLDPDVKMKDSGVEWIDEIPEHWEEKRIKYLFREKDLRNNDKDAILLSLFTSIGVRPRSQMEDKGNKSQTVMNYKVVNKGDIVVNKLLAWMGSIGISAYDGVTSPDYDIYMPVEKEKISNKYYHYYFRSFHFKGDCYKYGRGIMLMRWRTYSDDFKKIKVTNPPLQEQIQIASYLDFINDEIDFMIQRNSEIISLLKEYRQSLIYEAVTGKIDVQEMLKETEQEEVSSS